MISVSNRLVRKPTIQQSLPKNELVELKSTHDKACMFCGKKESSEMLYGPLYQFGNVVVHFFCIVSILQQNFILVLCIYIYFKIILIFSCCLKSPFKMVQMKKVFWAFYLKISELN